MGTKLPKLIAQRVTWVSRVLALNDFQCVCNDVGALFVNVPRFFKRFLDVLRFGRCLSFYPSPCKTRRHAILSWKVNVCVCGKCTVSMAIANVFPSLFFF